LIAIIIIIACAKIGGYVSLKLGFPSVLGELTVGILLGPSVFECGVRLLVQRMER
jgi:Kef-type K+ transport system membrane component KefB